jgi:uncharacterized zinc-type alcohol dehydrogenase-like protein
MVNKVKAFASFNEKDDLREFEFTQRELTEDDILVDILYCGVCHSDLHIAKNDFGRTIFPIVPGHEIIGIVKECGKNVSKLKIGDYVGVGCLVGSCGHCIRCKQDTEQHCKDYIMTFNSRDDKANRQTFGGYATEIIANQKFVYSIGKNLQKNLPATASLLCAGITTYAPLKRWAKKGDRVAILGLGGLGHMAIKFANSFGCEVTVLSTSPNKKEDALKLGAKHFELSTPENLSKLLGKFDVIISTISGEIDYASYMQTLDIYGVIVLLGIHPTPSALRSGSVIYGEKIVTGSLIGGTTQTQEMLDYCDANNIFCDIEIINMQDINRAYQRMLKSDVKYRFVIDMKSLKEI